MFTSLRSLKLSSPGSVRAGFGRALRGDTRGRGAEGGFTLIELLMSAAIVTIVSGLVLAKFSSFDSTVLLKSEAYNIASTIREAQVFSVSVYNTLGGGPATFRYPYGVSFTAGQNVYKLFRYNDGSTSVIPQYDTVTSGKITDVRTIGLSGSMVIDKVCTVRNGTEDCTHTRLDISFRRPEFSAIFFANNASAPLNETDRKTISAGRIYVKSTRNNNLKWVIEVKILGQITVYAANS